MTDIAEQVTLTEAELTNLRAKAEAALLYNDGQSWQMDPGKQYEVAPSVFYPVPEEPDQREVIVREAEETDADFIATFDPPMVLRLLALAARLAPSGTEAAAWVETRCLPACGAFDRPHLLDECYVAAPALLPVPDLAERVRALVASWDAGRGAVSGERRVFLPKDITQDIDWLGGHEQNFRFDEAAWTKGESGEYDGGVVVIGTVIDTGEYIEAKYALVSATISPADDPWEMDDDDEEDEATR